MDGVFDILAARGNDITNWMDLLVPVVLVGIYVINWLVSKAAEAAKKDPDQTQANDTPPPPLHSPLKTSPTNRAVSLKRQQPTLSSTLGRIAGQIANQANPQAPRPVGPALVKLLFRRFHLEQNGRELISWQIDAGYLLRAGHRVRHHLDGLCQRDQTVSGRKLGPRDHVRIRIFR